MTSCAQTKTDLSSLRLKEDAGQLLNGVPGVIKGEMFNRPDMISYGVNNNAFTYRDYIPEHIEILSYKGELAGYAFKIYTLADQDKIISYLKEKYKNLTAVKSKNETYYSYKNKGVFVEFTSFTQEEFKKGMNAYLSVKRLDFYEAFEKLANQH